MNDVRDAIVSMLDEDVPLRQAVYGCLGIMLASPPNDTSLECLYVKLKLRNTKEGAEGFLTLTCFGQNVASAKDVAVKAEYAVRESWSPVYPDVPREMRLQKEGRSAGFDPVRKMRFVRLRYTCHVRQKADVIDE